MEQAEPNITQDYISQSIALSSLAIYNFYLKVLMASTEIDVTDTELVHNIHKLSGIAKSLVLSHAQLADYGKLETVKAAIKTLNGIQEYFQEQPEGLSEKMQQQCQDTLIGYLKEITDDQLELFDL